MKIRLWSDIHNEFGRLNWTRRDDDKETTLVIAGDFQVGDNHFDLLLELCNAFKYVLYTCGNHEYYRNQVQAVDRKLSAFEADCKNFYFLNPGHVVLDGVRFVGATLWTDMNKGDPIVVGVASTRMNDYNQIKFAEKFSFEHDEKRVVDLTPWHTVELNRQHAEYIEKVLAEPFEGKTVVFTHHAPLMQSVGNDPRYRSAYGRNDMTNFFYGNTNLERLFYDYEFVAWFHGHVHHRQEYTVNGKQVMARPRGYDKYEICAKVYDDAHMDADVFEI